MALTVLLIDGDRTHAAQMQQFLSQRRPQWSVVQAASLAEGQSLHTQHRPHVAVVSMRLGDGDALHALPWLGCTMSMVVVRAGEESLAAAAMRAGYTDFVVQPERAGSTSHLQTLPEQIESLARQRATQDALEAQSRELQTTLASISQGIISMDADERVHLFNDRVQELTGLPRSLLQSTPHLRDLVEVQRARGEFEDGSMYWPPDAVLGASSGAACPPVYIRKTPEGRYLEVRTHPECNGRKVRTYTDVTDYVLIQQQLRDSEQRWRSMTELSSDWFWELDAQLCFVHLEGCPAPLHERLMGRSFFTRALWEKTAFVDEVLNASRNALVAKRVFHDWELCHTGPDGESIWLSLSGAPVLDVEGRLLGYRGVAQDITARKLSEEEVRRLAYSDDLTGLPNRSGMLQLLEVAVQRSLHLGAGAVLIIDIDRFKDVNDSMGHRWGDALLQEVSVRLKTWCRQGDIVGRVGGDEFVVMIEGLAPDVAQATARAGAMAISLLGLLGQPYELEGRAVHASFGIGLAGFQGLERSVDSIRQCVELALSEAKAQGRNAWSAFDPQLQQLVKERTALEADIHIALERGDFVLHYQPVVDGAGRILGAEALARWPHSQRGMVSPAAFIPVAEQMGLIFALDRRILRLACEQLAIWARSPATAHWTLAVNLSAQEFRHVDFVARMQDVLRDTGAPPERLKLELTESLMLEDVENSISKMKTLRDWGIHFSLDDFGTGYSSLGYLKRLPLSQLKIDQSFVRDVLQNANDAAIVRTVIALGQSLGLEVVAEGVETQEQLQFLITNGCKRFQGYWFARPGSAEAMLALASPAAVTG